MSSLQQFRGHVPSELDRIEEWVKEKRREESYRIEGAIVMPHTDYLCQLNYDLRFSEYDQQMLKTQMEILAENKSYDDKCKEINVLKSEIKELKDKLKESQKDCNYRKKRMFELTDELARGQTTVSSIREEIQWW